MITSAHQWAWFAGVFEGEGCISLVGRNSVNLRINMTDRDVLLRVQALVGGTVVASRKAQPHHKDKWTWQVTNADRVAVALAGMKPYLGARRSARVEEAERRLAGVRRPGHCFRGHALTGENHTAGSWRGCRTCRTERERRAARS